MPTDPQPPDGAVSSSRLRTLSGGGPGVERNDWVATEAPLEIRIGPRPAVVLMRTPGHDEELARGFLFSESLIDSPADIISIGHIPGLTHSYRGNVLIVELVPSKAGAVMERLFASNSSCGVCGKKTIASLELRGSVAPSGFSMSRRVLAELPGRLRAAQPAFDKTGGIHASALFTAAGELVAAREDVGRHNAVDKLVGWAMTAGRLPLGDVALLVSGRVSYEIVQKAVAAGIPLIAAVGAPSSLAIDLAERHGVTLAGFLRPGAMNVYAHPGRIGEEGPGRPQRKRNSVKSPRSPVKKGPGSRIGRK